MKKKLLLSAILILTVFGAKAQTVYFLQNFNTTNTLADYKQTGTDPNVNNNKNKFEDFPITNQDAPNYTPEIKVENNKLIIVKNGGSGGANVNRAAVTKTNPGFNPSGTDGFIKFSMEVTVSNNTVNVPNGFRFSIGTFAGGTAPFSPAAGSIHSDLYISPTATPGEFILQGGGTTTKLSSSVLSGTQKLVWYINNTGNEAGYAAPNGATESVDNDCSDVWAISGTTATRVLRNFPATTATVVGLRNLKITNDDNFIATLAIDDIEIAEAQIVPLPVSLISFTGASLGENIRLNWSTASEQKNSHFEILRSADGKTFENIGTVQGNGTSSEQHFYSYTDRSPLAGVNYYRLKQVDYNGTATEHQEMVSVRSFIKSKEFKVLVSADGKVQFMFYADKSVAADLMISDIQGRKIYANTVSLEKGYNSVAIPNISLPDGILIGQATVNGQYHSCKFRK